ncbi:MAG: hypothetical protein IH614_10080 [Desulfuromonadales bacterium]|nr:hypothetical protein [Desulfuromonadales bacterium]
MKKTGKVLLCPNCFSSEYREVLATATSRNVVDDDSPRAETPLFGEKRRTVVQLYCNHCGHELHPQGCRA